MATYDGSVNQYTGWSDRISYNIGSNPLSDASYATLNGSWFMQSWWESKRWAKKYTNLTPMRQRLTQASFMACSGHSNGQLFMTSNGYRDKVWGAGCTFECQVYIEGHVDGEGNAIMYSSTRVTLPSIDKYNCTSIYGVGVPHPDSASGTGFGNPGTFGPGTSRHLDTRGRRRDQHEQILRFDAEAAPVLNPGQSMYLIIHPTEWYTSDDNNALLVIKKDASGWESVFEPEPANYIWQFTDAGKWEKVLPAYQFTSEGWKTLER